MKTLVMTERAKQMGKKKKRGRERKKKRGEFATEAPEADAPQAPTTAKTGPAIRGVLAKDLTPAAYVGAKRNGKAINMFDNNNPRAGFGLTSYFEKYIGKTVNATIHLAVEVQETVFNGQKDTNKDKCYISFKATGTVDQQLHENAIPVSFENIQLMLAKKATDVNVTFKVVREQLNPNYPAELKAYEFTIV